MAFLSFLTSFMLCWISLCQTYIFVDQPMTFNAAQSYCISTYETSLASIHSSNDNIEAESLCIPKPGNPDDRNGCWIGLNDLNDERYQDRNGWSWTDATSYNYSKWGASEPNDFHRATGGEEDCVLLWNISAEWIDGDCNWTQRILCNYPLTASPTTSAPTAISPTTASPTTSAPTTAAPVTSNPTTSSPTTAAPSTAIPSTTSPTTTSSTQSTENPTHVSLSVERDQFTTVLSEGQATDQETTNVRIEDDDIMEPNTEITVIIIVLIIIGLCMIFCFMVFCLYKKCVNVDENISSESNVEQKAKMDACNQKLSVSVVHDISHMSDDDDMYSDIDKVKGNITTTTPNDGAVEELYDDDDDDDDELFGNVMTNEVTTNATDGNIQNIELHATVEGNV